jgi:glycosyltransferase involved in cell wall biosynthesis
VVGNSALLFDPRSPDALEEQMERFTDICTRERFIAEGKRNVARFSWERTAAEFLTLADENYDLQNSPNAGAA